MGFYTYLKDVGAALFKTSKTSKTSQSYTIRQGDTLSKISEQFYGNANNYTAIVEANKGVIESADKIYPGQNIRIPPLTT